MDKNRFETQKEVLYLDYTGKITRPQNFFTVEDLKWLMEQAEKVQELQRRIDKVTAECGVNWINEVLQGKEQD